LAGNTTIEKPRKEWTEEERRLVQLNLKASFLDIHCKVRHIEYITKEL